MKNLYFIFGLFSFSVSLFSCQKNNIFGDTSQNYFLDIRSESVPNLGPMALKKEIKKVGTFYVFNPNNWVGGKQIVYSLELKITKTKALDTVFYRMNGIFMPGKKITDENDVFLNIILNQELSNGMNSSPVEIFVRRSIENLEEAEIISISPETLNLNKDGAQEKISPRSKKQNIISFAVQ